MFKTILWFTLGVVVVPLVFLFLSLSFFTQASALSSLPMRGMEISFIISGFASYILLRKKNYGLAAGIIASLVVVVALYFFAAGSVQPPKVGTDVSHWLTVQGVVERTDSWAPPSNGLGGYNIYYSYFVGTKRYKSRSFQYVSNSKDAQDVIVEHPLGAPIEVKYNPKRPQESFVLELNPSVMF